MALRGIVNREQKEVIEDVDHSRIISDICSINSSSNFFYGTKYNGSCGSAKRKFKRS